MAMPWAYAAIATAGAALAWRIWTIHSSSQDEPSRRHALHKLQEQFHRQFADVPELDVQQVQALQKSKKSNLVLVDVRSTEEQQVSMLPGENVLTQEEFERRRDEYQHSTIVCYCTAGYRSAQLAHRLQQQGMNVYNLSGSILAWTHAGLPLVSGVDRQQPSRRVHVYAKRWALQADGYQPVWFKAAPLRMVQDLMGSLFAPLHSKPL